MDRKLASIQKVLKLSPIEGADKIEKATVLGWSLVVKKGEFKEGDLCIYMEVDSFIPKRKEFEFLGDTKKMLYEGKEIEGYRLRTVRLRGQVSQGLALPLGMFASELKIQDIWTEGNDVTEKLGIVKYEAPLSASLSGVALGVFPSFIPKTDETRLQAVPEVLKRYKDVPFYVTEKVDGSSTTFFIKDDQLHCCGRNIDLKETEGNSIWQVARELKLEEKLSRLPNIALQGEIIGSKIQGNKLKINGHKILFFNAYDIDAGSYLDFEEFSDLCKDLELETVPVVSKKFFLLDTVDDMVKLSTAKSAINPDVWVEGYVYRPLDETRDEDLGRLSFKVINPEFLLEYHE